MDCSKIFKLIDDIFAINKPKMTFESELKIKINDKDFLTFSYQLLLNDRPITCEVKQILKMNDRIVSIFEVYYYFERKRQLNLLISTLQKEVIDGL